MTDLIIIPFLFVLYIFAQESHFVQCTGFRESQDYSTKSVEYGIQAFAKSQKENSCAFHIILKGNTNIGDSEQNNREVKQLFTELQSELELELELYQNIMKSEVTFPFFVSTSIHSATHTQSQRDGKVLKFMFKCETFLIAPKVNGHVEKYWDSYSYSELFKVGKPSVDIFIFIGPSMTQVWPILTMSSSENGIHGLKWKFALTSHSKLTLEETGANEKEHWGRKKRALSSDMDVYTVYFARENFAGSRKWQVFEWIWHEPKSTASSQSQSQPSESTSSENPMTTTMTMTMTVKMNMLMSMTMRIDRAKINLNGVFLKVSGIVLPPYMILNKERRIIGGTFCSVFEIASKYYNFTYDMSTDPKPTGTQLKNGSWTGMMGDVVGEKDIGMCIHVTHARWGHLDFTTYMHNERAFFLMAHPETSVKWNALYSPFTPSLWLLYGLAFLCIIPPLFASFKIQNMNPDSLKQEKMQNTQASAGASTNSLHSTKSKPRTSSNSSSSHSSKSSSKLKQRLREKTGSHGNSSKKLLGNAFYIPFAITLDQDAGTIPTDTTGRFLVALWLIFVIVVSTGYKDKLMSYLTFPEPEPIPRNLNEVFQRPDFKMIFHFWGSTMLDRFKNKHNPLMLALGKRLVLEKDAAKCVTEATIRQRTLCLGVKSFLSPAMGKNVTLNSAFQSYQTSEGLFFPIYLSFPLKKHSVYTGAWERIAGFYRESTIIWRLTQKVFNGFQKSGRSWMLREKEGESARVYQSLSQMIKDLDMTEKPLIIKHFLVVFAIYLFFHGLCFILFLWEIISKISKKNSLKTGVKNPSFKRRSTDKWKFVLMFKFKFKRRKTIKVLRPLSALEFQAKNDEDRDVASGDEFSRVTTLV